MNAIEKGKNYMQNAKCESLATIAFDSVLLGSAESILEQTAKAYAVEELEKLIANHIDFGDDVDPNDIVNRIKELKEE